MLVVIRGPLIQDTVPASRNVAEYNRTTYLDNTRHFYNESNIPAGFVGLRRSSWKIHKADRPRRVCCRPTFVSGRSACSSALCAEQCAAPAIMCRFVSDRFLRSYIFHVGPGAFPRVAPLKVPTTAKRFVALPHIPLRIRPASPELIAATREFSKIFL